MNDSAPTPDPAAASEHAFVDDPAGAADAGPAVTPFWECLPRLLQFPLQRAVLTQITLATFFFSMVTALVFPQLAGAPLRGGLVLLLAWLGSTLYVARFGFLVIERSASGYLDTRGYPPVEGQRDLRRPLKMFALVVLLPMFIAVPGALFLPSLLVSLLLVALALLLPAAAMVMTMTDNFREAVSPARANHLALGMGPPYLLLSLVSLVLLIGAQQVVPVLLTGLGASAPLAARSIAGYTLDAFGVSLAGNYFLILDCALIGYAMFQYSDALGVSVVGPGEAPVRGPTSSAAHARRVREAMIGTLTAEGNIREAVELISDELRERPSDLSLHARLHALLLREGAAPRIREHANRYLGLLLAAGSGKQALELFEQTRASHADFLPSDPARLTQLAGAAMDATKLELSAQLIRGFDRRFPGHPNIPDAYVLGARILLQAGREPEAQRLLKYVTQNFAQSPASAEAARFLQRFDASAEKPTRSDFRMTDIGQGTPPKA